MKQNKVKMSLLLLFLSANVLYAQDGTVANGGDITGAGGTLSYSIGQVFYETLEGEVRQGVQQVYDISDVGVSEFSEISLVSAFPNPTVDQVTLGIQDLPLSNFTYQLCDINGKLISLEDVVSSQTKIDMSMLAPSTYLLNVIDGGELLKSFKIIKK